MSTLPIGLVTSLSRAGVASLADTMTMWQGVTVDMFSTWEGSIEELSNACVRANREQGTFPTSYLPVMLHCLTETTMSASKRTDMIIQVLQMVCSWADVVVVLPLLEEEYGALVGKKRAHLSTSTDDRRLGVIRRSAQKCLVVCRSGCARLQAPLNDLGVERFCRTPT
ncbi:hypothetical protein DNF23_01885 [Pseudomonas syringae pv. pisi]